MVARRAGAHRFLRHPGLRCSLPALTLAQPDFEVASVITQPDRPHGRGDEMSVSAVKAAAQEANLPVFQPEKIRSEDSQAYLQSIAADVIVIIAYGQIIPARLIAIPRLGWINLHGSLLPKYRGAAPINWAIVNGEARTGLTTMQIDPGLDTGPMLLKYETEIAPDETTPQLAARLSEAGAPLMVETLRNLAAGEIQLIPQDDSQASFAPILKKEDGLLDWSLTAQQIYDRIRGLSRGLAHLPNSAARPAISGARRRSHLPPLRLDRCSRKAVSYW